MIHAFISKIRWHHFALLAISLLGIVLHSGCSTLSRSSRHTGPWNLELLEHAPAAQWGSRTGLVQEVYYQGVDLEKKPTRVFAFLGRPEGRGPFPAMLLVHGGGGKAFRDWADHWAKRGYVALAMDLSGNGPNGRLPDGGPNQDDATKFRPFSQEQIPDMWTYHAVAAVLRGHALLAALPEVDSTRVGITGISWGGYLTCIIAGIDPKLKVAVPVYGCGFLGENSVWKDRSLAALPEANRDLWLRTFDPSQYLPGVNCPILFLNGSNDFAYPMDSYRKSYRLVHPRYRHVAVIVNLPHGHIWTFPEVDRFVDHTLRSGPALPRVSPIRVEGTEAKTKISGATRIKSAALSYTQDIGPWQQRKWSTIPAKILNSTVTAELPGARPLTFFFALVDEHDNRLSSEHESLNSSN